MGRILVVFTEEQEELLKSLVGLYGNSLAEVVRNLVLMKLDDKSFIKEAWAKKSG